MSVNITVAELVPGMRFKSIVQGEEWTVICVHTPHPLYSNLSLVVWWNHDRKRYSFDALRNEQDLSGMIAWVVDIEWRVNLRNTFQEMRDAEANA